LRKARGRSAHLFAGTTLKLRTLLGESDNGDKGSSEFDTKELREGCCILPYQQAL
jgi:hypothetical protein